MIFNQKQSQYQGKHYHIYTIQPQSHDCASHIKCSHSDWVSTTGLSQKQQQNLAGFIVV